MIEELRALVPAAARMQRAAGPADTNPSSTARQGVIIASNDVRAWIYPLVTPLLAVLVALGYLSDTIAPLIGAVVVAALGSGLAWVNTAAFWRKWVYGLIAPVSALVLALGWAEESVVAAVVGLLVPALGFTLASAKTPTVVDGAIVSVTDVEMLPEGALPTASITGEPGNLEMRIGVPTRPTISDEKVNQIVRDELARQGIPADDERIELERFRLFGR